MKKILLVMAALFCVATVSAQKSVVETVKDSKWSAGLRVSNGIQGAAECFYSNNKYVEARFGLSVRKSYYGGWVALADFTALHNWNCCNWNWTPDFATWFLDAGCGVNVGGCKNLAYVGAAGMVKFGMKFKKVPIRLAVDYTPVLGAQMVYGKNYLGENYCDAYFFSGGLTNFGLSATWCF